MRRFRPKTTPPAQPLDRIEQGRGGERQLQDWLDRSRLPYLFLDQTPLTIPLSLRSQIKRPDFLVPIDTLGTIALDAKAKNLVDGNFVLDEYERRTLGAFEALFQTPVWYVCFPPGRFLTCHLFRNQRLCGPEIGFHPNTRTLHIPLSLGLTVQPHAVTFSNAMISAFRII
jgi:hypothetical protein